VGFVEAPDERNDRRPPVAAGGRHIYEETVSTRTISGQRRHAFDDPTFGNRSFPELPAVSGR